MLHYPSVHGRFKGFVEAKDSKLWAEGKPISVFQEEDPANIKSGDVGAESTGVLTTEKCAPCSAYITGAPLTSPAGLLLT